MDSLLYDIIGEGYEETLKRYLVFAVNLFITFGVFYAVLKFLGGVEGGSMGRSKNRWKKKPRFLGHKTLYMPAFRGS